MIEKIFLRFCFICIITIVTELYCYCQNTGPSSPEVASFEPVDGGNMVDLLTGDLSYSLPLVHVPSPEGGYPLAISYHAGITMDQEASWVGLGWNVNPGAIARNVNSFPDDWNKTKLDNLVYSYLGGKNGVTDPLSPKSIDPSSSVALTPPLQIA